MVVTQDQVFQFSSHNTFTIIFKKFHAFMVASLASTLVSKVVSLQELYHFTFQPNHKITNNYLMKLHVKSLNCLLKLRERTTKSLFSETLTETSINTFRETHHPRAHLTS